MTEAATFGMGCFWAPEEHFTQVSGVVDTTVGYMGGEEKNISYKDVCRRNTDYTEVVQITYDPKKVSYKELLKHFWENHDSTREEKTQYQSIIFYHNDKQKSIAEESKREKQQTFKRPIVTILKSAGIFCKAEEYHQKYLAKQRGEYA